MWEYDTSIWEKTTPAGGDKSQIGLCLLGGPILTEGSVPTIALLGATGYCSEAQGRVGSMQCHAAFI